MRRLGVFAQRLMAGVFIVALCIAGTELALQGYLEARRVLSGDGDTLYQYQHGSHAGFEQMARAVSVEGSILKHTYLSTIRRPVPADGTTITLGDHGFRASCCAAEGTPKKVFFVFGGSTVFGTGVDDAHTLPSYLNRLGAERGWVFLNYGIDAYSSNEEVLSLALLLRDEKVPNAAIFYHGFNDINDAVLGHPGIEYYTYQLDRATANIWVYVRQRYLINTAIWRMVRSIDNRWLANPDAASAGQPITAASVQPMIGTRKLAQTLADAYGIELHHYLQPTLLTGREQKAGLLSPFEQAIYDKYVPDRALTIAGLYYDTLRATGHWVDLSGVFVKHQASGVYFDQVHLGPRGNQLVAREIFADLVHRDAQSRP